MMMTMMIKEKLKANNVVVALLYFGNPFAEGWLFNSKWACNCAFTMRDNGNICKIYMSEK